MKFMDWLKSFVVDNITDDGEESSVVKLGSNLLNLFQFMFSVMTALLSITFSVINIIFRLIKDGPTPAVIILLVFVLLYCLIIVIHYIIYDMKRKRKDTFMVSESIHLVKFIASIIKLAIPIVLLFNLVGNSAYDFITILVSGFSILVGFLSFLLSFLVFYAYAKSYKERKQKYEEKRARRMKKHAEYVDAQYTGINDDPDTK